MSPKTSNKLQKIKDCITRPTNVRGCGEKVDTTDSKSVNYVVMRVRVPPSSQNYTLYYNLNVNFFKKRLFNYSLIRNNLKNRGAFDRVKSFEVWVEIVLLFISLSLLF